MATQRPKPADAPGRTVRQLRLQWTGKLHALMVRCRKPRFAETSDP